MWKLGQSWSLCIFVTTFPMMIMMMWIKKMRMINLVTTRRKKDRDKKGREGVWKSDDKQWVRSKFAVSPSSFFHSSSLPNHISSFTNIHKQCHPHFQHNYQHWSLEKRWDPWQIIWGTTWTCLFHLITRWIFFLHLIIRWIEVLNHPSELVSFQVSQIIFQLGATTWISPTVPFIRNDLHHPSHR